MGQVNEANPNRYIRCMVYQAFTMSELEGRAMYRPPTGLVLPRPIAWVLGESTSPPRATCSSVETHRR